MLEVQQMTRSNRSKLHRSKVWSIHSISFRILIANENHYLHFFENNLRFVQN